MIERFVRFLLSHRSLATALILGSMGLAGFAAKDIQLRFQYRDFYDYPGSPGRELLKRYIEDFGDPGGYVVLLIESEDVFSEPVLRYIDKVGKRLRPNPLFSSVKSLTTANLLRAHGDGVDAGPLVSHVPADPGALARIRETALDSDLLVRTLVSEDASVTAVLAQMRTPATFATIDQQRDAVAAVTKVVRVLPPPPGVKTTVTGAPEAEVQTTLTLLRDQALLTPAAVVVVAAMLLLTFRSFQGMILPLTAVGVALVWTAGVFGLTGRAVDITSSTIPSVLLVYGVVDPVFVLSRYLRHTGGGTPRTEAIVATMSEMLLPCFLTSLTTVLGFAAFTTATMPIVKNFGTVVAIGVAFSFVTTIVVLPLLLSAVPVPQSKASPTGLARRIDALLVAVHGFVQARRRAILTSALVVIGLGIVALINVPVNTSYFNAGPESSKAGVQLLQDNLSGVIRVSVLLEGPVDSMKRPEVLEAMERVDRFATRQDIVGSSVGLSDYIAEANRAFNGGDDTFLRIPQSTSLIAQYLSLIDPVARAEFVSDDYRKTHIRMLVDDAGSQAGLAFREELQRFVDAQDFEQHGVQASITGNIIGYQETTRAVQEVMWGFLYAFLIILIVQWVVFRSALVAVASITPNLVPCAVCFLTMWVLGIDLRVDTSVVLCVSIGGLFNTTIQFVARAFRHVRAGASDADAIVLETLRSVGPPSIYAATILSVGFAVMLLSEFAGLRDFGLLCSITLITASIADATVTTALLGPLLGRIIRQRKLSDPENVGLSAATPMHERA